MKKTLLTIIAALLLGGVVNAQSWGENPDSHAQPSNTPIVASITVNGESVTLDNTMRLGAFVNDSLRGIAAPHTDGKFWIQVFYTDGNDVISFKFYDGTDEYTTCETTLTGAEDGYGTPSAPQVLNFLNGPTQQTALVQGWNWWSTCVEITDGAVALTSLENSLGTAGIKIGSLNDGDVEYYDFNGGLWYGELNSICNEQMYKVQTNAPINCELNGNAAVPSNHPITINESWNWIGFPCAHEVSFEVALSGFTPSHLDEIKSLNGDYSQYYVTPSFTGWYGNFTKFEPGKGYKYKSTSSESKTLTYQTGREGSVINSAPEKYNIFNVDELAFGDNMTITAVVEIEGKELREDGFELAAFVGNECRGSVKLMYVEPIDRYVAFLSVIGDSEVSIRFVLTDGNDISWSSDYLTYTTDAIIGNLLEPTILHFGTLGLNDNINHMVNIYPNPSNNIFNIEGNAIRKVEVINAFGQIVYAKETKGGNLQIDLSNCAIGTYILRVVSDEGVSIKQLIKK